ncbi:hypothetical protein [Mycolicibacterium alvei]|nr:hypothetical protein [Mycolicibacterium alvei]
MVGLDQTNHRDEFGDLVAAGSAQIGIDCLVRFKEEVALGQGGDEASNT